MPSRANVLWRWAKANVREFPATYHLWVDGCELESGHTRSPMKKHRIMDGTLRLQQQPP
jgi:hypothetical protein